MGRVCDLSLRLDGGWPPAARGRVLIWARMVWRVRSLTEICRRFSSSLDALACGVSGVSWWPRIAGQSVVDAGDAVGGERQGEVHAVDQGGGVIPGVGLHGVAVGGLHTVEGHAEIGQDVDEGTGTGDFGCGGADGRDDESCGVLTLAR